MLKLFKVLILGGGCLFLTTIQQSLLFSFKFPRINFLIILTFILIFFILEKKEYLELLIGLIIGIILDFFSPFLFGVFALNLTILSFLIKNFSKIFQKSHIIGTVFLFLIYFFGYKIILFLELKIINIIFNQDFIFPIFSTLIFFEIFCSLFLICLVWLIKEKQILWEKKTF